MTTRPVRASSATTARDGAGRGAEVAVGEREHGRRDQKIPHNKRQLADHQPGEGGQGAEPGPPGEGARHAPGHGRDRPQVPDRHQEPPAMRGRMHAGWPSAVGSALSPRTRPAFLGELWVLVTMCSGSMSCGTSRAPTAPLAPATELRIVSPRYSDRQDVTRRGCGRRHPEVDMAGGVSGAGPRHESADSAQRIRVNGSGPAAASVRLAMARLPSTWLMCCNGAIVWTTWARCCQRAGPPPPPHGALPGCAA